ncbi:MAG: carboxylesterase family protein, partial [Smithellaceae bacterium]|nr:carboxylesterase family protein [Smithellaceae bacterium]
QKKRKSCYQKLCYAFSLMALGMFLAAGVGCKNGEEEWFGSTVVKTGFGYVRGSVEDGVSSWKGIPYAKPPVGELRWAAPVDPDPWQGVRNATEPCVACAQQEADKFWRAAPGEFVGSEDCLYLDIYRPGTPARNLPVYVWIHGGANVMGAAALYEGAALAKRGNMIVVVIQYRLGMFGWLAHPAFRSTGTALDQSGNFGTLDHMKALAWVQNNIEAFGGDPGRVTIGGQSAGGQHVMNLIITPLVNTFHRALAMSPALTQLMPLRPLADGDAETDALIDWLLVDDGTCADAAAAAAYRAGMSDEAVRAYLRGKAANKIMQAAIAGPGGGASMPVPTSFLDGVVLPATSWLEAIQAGNFKKVPLIIGTTKYEYKDLMTLYGAALKMGLGVPSGAYSWNNLYDVLNGTLTFDEVLPTAGDQFAYEQSGLLKARKWQYDVNQIARAIKAENAANAVYTYLFAWAGGGDPALEDFRKIFGASHAQDVPFLFGDEEDLFRGYSFTPANQAGRVALQGAMMDYLSAFVNTGNPNPAASALLPWTQWSNADGENKFLIFDADLDRAALVMSNAEATAAIVNNEILTALATDPNAPSPVLTFLFAALGVLPLL